MDPEKMLFLMMMFAAKGAEKEMQSAIERFKNDMKKNFEQDSIDIVGQLITCSISKKSNYRNRSGNKSRI